jgi:DNA/RNA endonuclease YhcR with UshA esterase domain
MKLPLLTITALLLAAFTYAQKTVKLEDVKQYVGDSVIVCGTVANVKYVDHVRGRPAFLDLGKPFPNQGLTIVVWGRIADQFKGSLDWLFSGKRVCVAGKLELYQNRPQIVLNNTEQIRLDSTAR